MARLLAEKYRPTRCLGSGRVSTAYEATDLTDDSKVVVKIFRPEHVKGPSSHSYLCNNLKRRFSINHPNITAVKDLYSLEISNGTKTVALITELIEGETLAKRIYDFANRPLSFRDILEILYQVLLGVEYLHYKDLPLKDFSPKRIRLTPEGLVKLPAFGFISSTDWHRNNSRILQISDVDYRYLSPELFEMPNLGKATYFSDIYMFGVLAFELGCGTPPFDANRATLMQLHRTDPLPRLLVESGLPDWYDQMVRHCTEKKPTNRISLADLKATLSSHRKDSSESLSLVPQYPANSGLHVLFVEDNKLDQLSLARAAKKERFPFSYEMVRSLDRAKEVITRKHFDVIVSDYMLPDGTALDVMKLAGNTPVIVITGAGREDIAREALQAGAFDYISKNTRNSHMTLIPEQVLRAANGRNALNDSNAQCKINGCIETALKKLSAGKIVAAQSEQLLLRNLEEIETTILNLKELMNSSFGIEKSAKQASSKPRQRYTESIDFYNGLSIIE
jgi:serine/threonine protein kinase